MKKIYFTFGTDPMYPYGIRDYVVVEAQDTNQAVHLFQMVHPNRPGFACVNCAAWYSEESFNKFRDQYYAGVQPIETISLQIIRN